MLSLFYRRKREGVNSIETVFGAIGTELPEHRIVRLPCQGASPLSLLRNIWFARKNRGETNQITGDCHYIALGTGRRTLLTIHDVGSAFHGGWLKRAFIRFLWFTLPCLIVKKITVISEATKRDLLKICPWAKGKIAVIPNPTDRRYSFNPKDSMSKVPRILHLGTKTNKNLERTLAALSSINCELTVIGKMSEAQLAKAKELKIVLRNRYDISIEDLVEEYRRSDIVSFPSLFEGFGMPVIEGQATGRPILAGDIPVLRDVAGTDGALFVDPLSEGSIRQGFQSLISDPELRSRLVSNGQKNIRRFQPEMVAGQYSRLYKQL